MTQIGSESVSSQRVNTCSKARLNRRISLSRPVIEKANAIRRILRERTWTAELGIGPPNQASYATNGVGITTRSTSRLPCQTQPPNRQEQQLKIEQEIASTDCTAYPVGLVGRRECRPAANLPNAGQAGHDFQSQPIAEGIERDLTRYRGRGPTSRTCRRLPHTTVGAAHRYSGANDRADPSDSRSFFILNVIESWWSFCEMSVSLSCSALTTIERNFGKANSRPVGQRAAARRAPDPSLVSLMARRRRGTAAIGRSAE